MNAQLNSTRQMGTPLPCRGGWKWAFQPFKAIRRDSSGRPIVAAAVTQRLKALPKKAATAAKKSIGTQRIGQASKPARRPAPLPGTRSFGGGTKKVTTIEQAKGAIFRQRVFDNGRPAPRLLARVEQLRLLSKLEQAGLLSLAEKNGVTLSKIENLGLLSKAESLGLLSAAADRRSPGLLTAVALSLFAAGPAAVYFIPDQSTPLVAVQVLVALLAVVGGSAAFGGSVLLNTLQR